MAGCSSLVVLFLAQGCSVACAGRYPELQWLLLSGRRRHAVSAAVSDALATCSAVHGDMMAGRSPLLVWMMRGCGAGVVCGGIGERLKAVRMALYVALLSRGGRECGVEVRRCSVLLRGVQCARRSAPWMQRCSVYVCMSCRVVWAAQGHFE